MNNTVGYVLLGSAVVPGLMGLLLSLKGLADTEAATKQVKTVAKAAAAHVQAATESVKALAADPANTQRAAVARTPERHQRRASVRSMTPFPA